MLVFIAVKPYQFPEVARELAGWDCSGSAIVSVMAGVPLSVLGRVFRGCEVYRAMPNLNARVGRSSTAVAGPGDGRFRGLVGEALSCIGSVYWLPEELMDAWTAFAGSGPAIIAEFLDALVLAGVAVGIPRETARSVALELLSATAEYLSRNGVHPAELRDEVTTPAGTTIAAIRVLEGKGFKSAVIDAVRDATRRGGEIAREVAAKLNSMLERGEARR